MTFNFYSDAGHGWLEVRTVDLINLEIYDKITSFSFVLGDKIYLEEDCDAGTFCEAYKARWGEEPKIKDIDHGEDSPIRGYYHFRGC